MRNWLLFIIFLPILATAQNGETYHLKLLAVQEYNLSLQGSAADLFLELREGTGRVFLDTYPITKFDTQISTRFAKDTACSYFNLDCNKHDFIYTIRSDSSIVGGPSAGAAMAALTSIAMLDLEYDQGIAVTGTINSGGVVGQVGGLPEKVNVAQTLGLKNVLIAKGTGQITKANQTIPLQHMTEGNLTIIEVVDLADVLFHLTGTQFGRNTTITIHKEYAAIMASLQDRLCSRTQKIQLELAQENVNVNLPIKEEINTKQALAVNATSQQDFYSAASYCFGNNIQLKHEFYKTRRPNEEETDGLLLSLQRKVQELQRKVSMQPIGTISDLQTLMVVNERLQDVRGNLADAQTAPLEEKYELLAYGEERFFSAESWREFFAMSGTPMELDKSRFRTACHQKISEAYERSQYVTLFLTEQAGITEKIELAKNAIQDQRWDLCLITASQAKGDANAILSTLGLSGENVPDFIASKSTAVEKVIAGNSVEGTFPILGYSYYKYAQSLKESNPYTALIYLEYALDMSDLSIYFPSSVEREETRLHLTRDHILVTGSFVAGIVVALAFMLLQPEMFKKLLQKSKKLEKTGRKSKF